MKVSELMDMVRRSALDYVSYDRGSLKETDFFGPSSSGRYHSVIHFVKEYDNGSKDEIYDSYHILDNDTIIHFDNYEEAMLWTTKNFGETYPKEIYTISYADREHFYRREKNLDILLD